MSVLRRLCAVLLVGLSVLLLAPPASAAGGDDYPYRRSSSSSSDRWGFMKRQCVSFVAWRMEQRHSRLDNRTQRWGSALQWDDAAERLGYRIGSRPVPGAIAQWNAYERSAYYAPGSDTPGTVSAGAYGHVGYVRGVYRDGSVSVEHYNLGGDRRYAVTRMRAPRYLYVGVRPPA